MPIRFLSNGTIELDTITEAVLWDRRKQKTTKQKKQPKVAPPITSCDPWEGFRADLSSDRCTLMRKLLGLVNGRGQMGIDAHELAKTVDSTPHVVAGTISGLLQKAKRHGLNPPDVVFRGDDKRYRPGSLLKTNEPPIP